MEYVGTNFYGWQYQKKQITIQGTVEKILKKILKEKVKLYGSGRTDSKVHAIEQSAHFDVKNKLNKLGIFGDELDEYICYLIDENYLSETRYSEAFVRGKYNNNNWGRTKIIMELKSKNISEWNINNALKQITEEEYENKLYKI